MPRMKIATDNLNGVNAGLRIDHPLPSPDLAGHLAEAGVDRAERGREKADDHAPARAALA